MLLNPLGALSSQPIPRCTLPGAPGMPASPYFGSGLIARPVFHRASKWTGSGGLKSPPQVPPIPFQISPS